MEKLIFEQIHCEEKAIFCHLLDPLLIKNVIKKEFEDKENINSFQRVEQRLLLFFFKMFEALKKSTEYSSQIKVS